MTSKSKKKNKNDKAAKKGKKKVGFNLPDDDDAAAALGAAPSSSSSSSSSSRAKKIKDQAPNVSNHNNVDDPAAAAASSTVRGLTTKLSSVPRIRPPGASPAIPHGAGLSRGQLAVVIVLALAVARLMQVGSAATEIIVVDAAASSFSDAFRPSPTCVDHLGEQACQRPEIRALLKYKYMLGLQSLVYVAAAIVPSWQTEILLQTLCAFLCLLLGLFGSALLLSLSSSGLREGVYGNAAMCLVLTVVAFPHERLPRQRTGTYKTLQSLCLLSLAVPHLCELIPLVQNRFLLGDRTVQQAGDASSVPSLLVRTTETEFWASHTPAVHAITNFVLFDRVTMILMLGFAWYYLPNLKQRTFLLSMAILHLGEYYLQQTEAAQDLRQHVRWTTLENRNHALLLSAGWCLLAWIAPPLKWKKKL